MLKTVQAVGKDLLRYFWPLSKRANLIRSIILVAAIVALVVFTQDTPATEEASAVDATPVVITTTADSIKAGGASSFIGTVRAVSEAQIQSEVGGRVTSVAVTPGQSVAAGTVIATLENASQRAAVLQAEGSYESALAAAAVGQVGISEARTTLTTAGDDVRVNSATIINTINSLYTGDLDVIVADTNDVYRGGSVVLRKDSVFINELEAAFRRLPQQIAALQAINNTPVTADNVTARDEAAQQLFTAVTTITTNIRNLIDDDDIDQTFEADETDFLNRIATIDSQITGLRSSWQATTRAYFLASDALARAELNASNQTASATDAQVKSALGSLRSAQAALAKTILRTPIAGTVNSVSVNTGDFIGAFTQIAEVANNDALEISIFVGERDLSSFAVGDTVQIENTITGTVTSISPALDPTTLKTEIRIGAESTTLVNGATVSVTKDQVATTTPRGPILVPLTAVKFTATNGSMFFVEDGVLSPRAVTIGEVRGSNIEILEGLDRSEAFVVDSRGLVAGTSVEARTN